MLVSFTLHPNAPGESTKRIHLGYQSSALRAFFDDFNTSLSCIGPLTGNRSLGHRTHHKEHDVCATRVEL
jgi:hypothetical protein